MADVCTFLLIVLVWGCNTAPLSKSDIGHHIGQFLEVENGRAYRSWLYQLLALEPEDENMKHATYNPPDRSLVGDMLLTSNQMKALSGDTAVEKRKMITNAFILWPDGIIPWKFDSADRKFTRDESYRAVTDAIEHWEQRTCLNFVRLGSSEYKHLRVRPHAILSFGTGHGCASPVGYIPGVQRVYLAEPTCTQIGTIIHEIGHVIGFFHEHARSDRDDHVTIQTENVVDDVSFNFLVTPSLSVKVNYDLGSVMHYGPRFFSKNGENTISPRHPFLEFLMGQREGLSFYDVQAANQAYACAENCRNNPLCKNGGFLVKGCICQCPDGLAGDTCSEIDQQKSQDGGIHYLHYGSSKLITSEHLEPFTKVTWLFKSPPHTTMSISMTLDLSHDSYLNMCFHWLEIRFNLIGQPGPRFCGSSFIPISLKTSTNLLIVVYSSDDVRYSPGGGFFLHVAVRARLSVV